jgi:hypothetical protein
LELKILACAMKQNCVIGPLPIVLFTVPNIPEVASTDPVRDDGPRLPVPTEIPDAIHF